jgi:hypothetical protein
MALAIHLLERQELGVSGLSFLINSKEEEAGLLLEHFGLEGKTTSKQRKFVRKLVQEKRLGTLKKVLEDLGCDTAGDLRGLQWRIQEAVHTAMIGIKPVETKEMYVDFKRRLHQSGVPSKVVVEDLKRGWRLALVIHMLERREADISGLSFLFVRSKGADQEVLIGQM